MIAVDTNILVYAHRSDCEWHEAALKKLLSLASGTDRWAIPWPCLHEFLAIVTHPRIYSPPTPVQRALESVKVWLDSPSCAAIGEGIGYPDFLQRLLVRGQIVGGMIRDARVAVICLYHGVKVLWTVDRDFSRFPDLATQNPLIS